MAQTRRREFSFLHVSVLTLTIYNERHAVTQTLELDIPLPSATEAPVRTPVPSTSPALDDELEGAEPLETLMWAVGRFGQRLTFATGFGPEGCVLIDLIGRHRLPVDLFTLDTGLLFPETRELWTALETRYNVTIRSVRPHQSVEQQAAAHGDQLWATAPYRCCEMRKVFPLQTELAKMDAWITAIRRDQTAERATARVVEPDKKFGLTKVNPLVRWTKSDVWSYLKDHEVPYNRLHYQGFPSIGCKPCTTPVEHGEGERTGRWRGITKTECGLHDHSIPAPTAVSKR